MKKNYLLVKTLAFIIVLVLSAVSSVFADEDGSWEQSYFEDFSNAEAARVLGKTKRQVENLSYRARQALRRQLETEGFAYEGYE